MSSDHFISQAIEAREESPNLEALTHGVKAHSGITTPAAHQSAGGYRAGPTIPVPGQDGIGIHLYYEDETECNYVYWTWRVRRVTISVQFTDFELGGASGVAVSVTCTAKGTSPEADQHADYYWLSAEDVKMSQLDDDSEELAQWYARDPYEDVDVDSTYLESDEESRWKNGVRYPKMIVCEGSFITYRVIPDWTDAVITVYVQRVFSESHLRSGHAVSGRPASKVDWRDSSAPKSKEWYDKLGIHGRNTFVFPLDQTEPKFGEPSFTYNIPLADDVDGGSEDSSQTESEDNSDDEEEIRDQLKEIELRRKLRAIKKRKRAPKPDQQR
ncbi:hypothetical protein LTR56_008788 [Elasticomyces elasticus]|nr:hypothetical protein LTR22_021964 [Elasticomyces elasticus]KAK3645910.1 hypothetical protein LTR56_008788 [Elasticomyces elasticus]KAK4928139.1 hypothetical protein LTR49_005077 [Elasticomyces elasticus]KAK5765891.1 hypothetical protein LTS12_003898 [Elasticomyces elasticus]